MTAGFNSTDSFKKLKNAAENIKQFHLRQLFVENPNRAEQLSLKTEHFYFDCSRQLVTKETIALLVKLANEMELKSKIDAMFNGEKINATEGRSVLHAALRDANPRPVIKEVLDHVKTFSKEILSGTKTGVTGKKFKNIVSIGIGGSCLGPEYLATALRPYAQPGMNLIFIANVDGADFTEKTAGLDTADTLIIIVSKTFTTAETMKNAATAKAWLLKGLNNHPEAIKKHFVAVSTAADKVSAFGIDPANMFGFWDWVGGRFSSSSAVGALPLALYLGYDNFAQILQGANWLDRHFQSSPFENNLPILSALLDIWNINFLGYETRALLPYAQGLAKLPAHTQQVEMESNGKSVDISGQPLYFPTGEIVFGEPGTNGQHSFYQLIHQGTQIIPCDFIGFVKPQYEIGVNSATEVNHHLELMTNFLAQPDALAFGKEDSNKAKNFPGNRPSSSLLLDKLTPFSAGLLLAWTEHRATVKGFIWGINSFDQFGVELGKVLGVEQRRLMLEFNATGILNTQGLNASTEQLLKLILIDNLNP
ncbi:glucose-6-phosphate isomerase [Candidatus Saganbacteria bacterium]|nr:glucose-6-phosphate isomerase [Candidatus Saganbacteria bacterium]